MADEQPGRNRPGPAGDHGPQASLDAAGPPASSPPASRGADMARTALDAARARNAANRARTKAGRTAKGAAGRTGGVAGRMGRKRWSGPGPDKRRDPQLLGETLKGWLAGTGAAKEVAKAALFARWAEVVGPDIAVHCEPASLVDGELVIQAESTAWATQLRMMAGTLAQRINTEIGRGTVTHIRTRGPSGPSWRFGNRHVAGRGPRDTYG